MPESSDYHPSDADHLDETPVYHLSASDGVVDYLAGETGLSAAPQHDLLSETPPEVYVADTPDTQIEGRTESDVAQAQITSLHADIQDFLARTPFRRDARITTHSGTAAFTDYQRYNQVDIARAFEEAEAAGQRFDEVGESLKSLQTRRSIITIDTYPPDAKSIYDPSHGYILTRPCDLFADDGMLGGYLWECYIRDAPDGRIDDPTQPILVEMPRSGSTTEEAIVVHDLGIDPVLVELQQLLTQEKDP
jgi:hypothetical protein